MSRSKFVLLAELCDRIEFVPGARRGRLLVADADLLASLRTVDSDYEEYGLELPNAKIDQVNVGDTVDVVLHDPRTGIGVFVQDVAELLQAPKRRVREPARFYLIETKFNSVSSAITPEAIQHYRNMLAFVALLKESAAYLDEVNADLIYIHEGRYDVPVRYKEGNLEQNVIHALVRLCESVGQDTHREQKLAILANVVREMTIKLQPEERFGYLLTHISDLSKRFTEGYRLFVSGFSYDKVRSELEAAKVEYTARIHKVITDIQNQLLAIPVATVIIATQMKQTAEIGYQFWVNVSVLLGAAVFVVLVALMLCNQLSTLSVLGTEIDRQQGELATKHKDIASNFQDVFDSLTHRLKGQRRILLIVGTILIIGLVLATVIFFLLTEPASLWATSNYNAFKDLVASLWSSSKDVSLLSDVQTNSPPASSPNP